MTEYLVKLIDQRIYDLYVSHDQISKEPYPYMAPQFVYLWLNMRKPSTITTKTSVRPASVVAHVDWW